MVMNSFNIPNTILNVCYLFSPYMMVGIGIILEEIKCQKGKVACVNNTTLSIEPGFRLKQQGPVLS